MVIDYPIVVQLLESRTAPKFCMLLHVVVFMYSHTLNEEICAGI